MAQAIQCSSCGAVLFEADIFCGECGAPRPASTPVPELAELEPPDTAPAQAAPAVAAKARQTPWRVMAIVLGILASILCLAGIFAFLLFGLTDPQGFTIQENWLYATLCCLLPIGGAGAILAIASLGIWFTRLRSR